MKNTANHKVLRPGGAASPPLAAAAADFAADVLRLARVPVFCLMSVAWAAHTACVGCLSYYGPKAANDLFFPSHASGAGGGSADTVFGALTARPPGLPARTAGHTDDRGASAAVGGDCARRHAGGWLHAGRAARVGSRGDALLRGRVRGCVRAAAGGVPDAASGACTGQRMQGRATAAERPRPRRRRGGSWWRSLWGRWRCSASTRW